jgi:DNA-binding NtrC family response regulator
MATPLEFLGMPAIVASREMQQVLERVRRLAPLDSAVLVTGESGVGKELIARALHHYSRRNLKPWVDVSCGALPEHLVESELFGYEKGAFSGAVGRKEGLFELANTGTLFLDEIGELDLRMQVKLLRVLDGATYFRLGGTRQIRVDVRIVAATNRDLQEEVRQGRFRADLYHRLAQLQILVPPLRQRPADIPALARFFIERQGFDKSLSPRALDALLAYPWPGNARELRNIVTGACALADHPIVDLNDLPPAVRNACQPTHTADVHSLAHAVTSPTAALLPNGGLLEESERRLILDVLDRMNGHHERTARALGISSRTLARKLRGYRMNSFGTTFAPEALS